MIRTRIAIATAALAMSAMFLIFVGFTKAQGTHASKIYAQKLVESVSAKHPEITGLELSSTPPHKTRCETIAATEMKEIGEKCDKDEFTAMRANKPFVEKEKENGQEVYDVTMPLHDSAGKVIGTIGLDFKSEPGQDKAKVVESAERIAKELESQIGSKEKLFEPAG